MINVDKKELGGATYTYYWSEYNSLRELVTDIESRPMNEKYVGTSSHKKETDGWSGVNSYEEARERLLSGDPTFSSDLLKELKSVKVASGSTVSRTRTVNNYYGYAPNVAAAVAGLPKAMRCKKRIVTKSKIVDLLFSPGMPYGVDQHDLFTAGKEFVKVINTLETNGFRVNVTLAVKSCIYTPINALATVKIKSANQPINIAKMGWALAAPSVFRRIGFRWLESCPVTTKIHGYGLSFSSADFNRYKLLFNKKMTCITTQDIIAADFDVMSVLKKQGLVLD